MVKIRPLKKTSKKRAHARVVETSPRLFARQGKYDGVREAFLRRSAAAIARIAEQADESALQDALAASTDVGTLAAILSDTEVVGEGVRGLDPMATLVARSAGHKAELLQRAGGAFNVAQVAELLGITRQAVDKRRREGKLLAVPRGSDFRYPAAQFADGEAVAGLREVLAAIGLRGRWGILNFLTAADDELDGATPLEWLRHHPDQLQPVLRLARAQGEHGA
jgi:hypothetical protein